jgi:DNA ligase-1
MQTLRVLQDFVNLSNESNSNTHKKEVIEFYSSNEIVKSLLEYTYNTFKQYGITSRNCKKRSDLIADANNYESIITLLDDLNNRTLTGHNAIKAYNRFVEDHREYEDLLWNIIDRNLKTRSTITMINKVIPNLIPTFDVVLAQTYDEKSKKNLDWQDGWYMSRKLDGVRCLCIIDDKGEAKFYSRAGKEFKTLSKLAFELSSLGLSDVVLDGEVCVMDEEGNEDFQGVIKQIKRKDFDMPNPKYIIFDYLTLEDFCRKESDTILSDRLKNLDVLDTLKSPNLTKLKQIRNYADDTFEYYVDEAIEKGWEGLMLRKDTVYEGKRSKDLLKVKKFYDAEYKVIDIEHDFNRVIVDGEEVEEMMLRNVVIEHRGNRVSVGSGFSHEQKRQYYANPDMIMGKTITVQYFEETTNQNGTQSLRFPTVKAVYEGERTF